MFMLYIWLAVIASGLLLEAVEAGTLVTIWFSVGAIIPFIMSFFGITETWYLVLQIVIFGIVTVLCLIFLRKITKRTLFKNNQEHFVTFILIFTQTLNFFMMYIRRF